MSKQKYLYWLEVEDIQNIDNSDDVKKYLRKMRKWCIDNFEKPALKRPHPNTSRYYRTYNDGWVANHIYDHDQARWMNKLNNSPQKFWFKDECDAMAFMLMFSGEAKFIIKMNKNFSDTRKPLYPKAGLFSCLM